MTTVSMFEAKTNLSKYVSRVADRQEPYVVILRNGKPVAKIVPFEDDGGRRIGLAKGKLAPHALLHRGFQQHRPGRRTGERRGPVMNILLDTHAVLWSLTSDPRLTPQAREMILSPDNVVCFSVVSLWEIAIKNQKSPEKCPYHEKEILDYCLASRYEPLNLLPRDVLALRNLQVRQGRVLSNLDPFDRLLIAQAKTENCVILTHDSNFSNYQENCITIF